MEPLSNVVRAVGRRTLATLAVACGAAACGAAAPAVVPPPDYSASTQVAHVPFAKKLDFDRLGEMTVRVSINGGPAMSLEVDTGSVGVIVGVDQVPNVDLNGEPASITYVSSGVEIAGVRTPATITFLDAKGPDGKPVTAELPVLAARTRMVHPGAVNGRRAATGAASVPTTPLVTSSPNHPPHPAMFGVGFARGKEGRPDLNPFLNLTLMNAGTMRRGYTITHDGFDLGLSPKNTAPGYVWEKLTERPVAPQAARARPGLRDWLDGRGSVTVGGGDPIPVGILMDTGLTNFMIELPSVTDNADVAPGTKVTVGLLGDRLSYSFVAGDKENPLAPRRVTWTNKKDFALLNTGLKSLAGYDYLYDADGGYLALRPTRR